MGIEGHQGAGFRRGRTRADVLADLAGDHARRAMEGTCRYCGVPWPCEPAVLLRYLRLLRARDARLREENAQLRAALEEAFAGQLYYATRLFLGNQSGKPPSWVVWDAAPSDMHAEYRQQARDGLDEYYVKHLARQVD